MEKVVDYKNYYRQELILSVGCFIATVVIFHISYGLKTLIPGNINWLMSAMHDWGTHYLGWHFYKNEPWQFPLGDVSNYFYPLGTNVGFTDSIPLLAIFFKLFSFILPEDFQYFGLWLLSCHLLTAYYTLRILKLFKIHPFIIFLSVLLITANPVLIYRGLHPALCAQWLLIGCLYVHLLKPSRVKPSRILGHQFVLLILSAMINPYLCFMVLGFSIILPLKLYFFGKDIGKRTLFLYIVSSIFSLLLLWYLIGMINFGKKEDLGVQGGFGLYGMNLNSFYNGQGYSRYLPAFNHVSWHQYEGFMYLGLGGMLLILFALVARILNIHEKSFGKKLKIAYRSNHHVFLLVLLIIYTLFSVSHVITMNSKVLITIPIPKLIVTLGEIFRASARFFWVIYYLMFFIAIIYIAKSRMKDFLKYFLMMVVLVLQFLDTWPLLTSRNLPSGSYQPPIDTKNWTTLITNFDEIVFYPPFQATNLTSMDYQFFCYLAAKIRKPINTGYVARFDNSAAQNYADSLQKTITEGKLSAGKLYITTSSSLTNFTLPVQSGLCNLNILDKYYYAFVKGSDQEEILSLAAELNKKNKSLLDSAMAIIGKKNRFLEITKLDSPAKTIIRYSIGKLNDEEKYISVGGWAFRENSVNSKGDSVFITLASQSKSYRAYTTRFQRPDLVTHFKKADLIDAGFNAMIFKDDLEPGSYTLGILIKSSDGSTSYQPTDQYIKVAEAQGSHVEQFAKEVPQRRMNFGFDTLETVNEFLIIRGWAAFTDRGMENCKIRVLFKSKDITYVGQTSPTKRPDVTEAIARNKFNLDNSGFNASISKNSLPPGTYQLGILVHDLKTGAENMWMTDKSITIQLQ